MRGATRLAGGPGLVLIARGGLAALWALGCAAPRSPERPAGGAAEQRAAPAAGDTSSPSPRSAGTTVYACGDGVRFSVRSTGGSRGDSLVVSLPERVDTLGHVEAASGVRYAGRGVDFWSKDEEACLEIGGVHHTGCRGRRAATHGRRPP